MSLRNNLIKLAHEKPELREKLLPMLKEADIKKAGSNFTFTASIEKPRSGDNILVILYGDGRGKLSGSETVDAILKTQKAVKGLKSMFRAKVIGHDVQVIPAASSSFEMVSRLFIDDYKDPQAILQALRKFGFAGKLIGALAKKGTRL